MAVPPSDISLLPQSVQAYVLNDPTATVMTDEVAASQLARAVGRRYYGGDFADKDLFLKAAAALPSAFKIQLTDKNVIEIIDARYLLNYLTNPANNAGTDVQAFAETEKPKLYTYYENRFKEEGNIGDALLSQYASVDVGLSPQYFILESAASGNMPDVMQSPPTTSSETQTTTSRLDEEGYNPGSALGSSLDKSVTLESELQKMRLDTSRTLSDLVKDFEKFGGNLEFNLEGVVKTDTSVVGQFFDPTKAAEYPWQLTEDKVRDLQSSLLQAGYYKKLDSFPNEWGIMDAATYSAWTLLIRDSVLRQTAPSNVLRDQILNYRSREMASDAGIPRKDPSEIFSIAQSLGEQLLGRGLTNAEVTDLTNRFRDWERTIVSQPWKMDPEANALNLQAKTEEYLRTTYQTDYIMEQFNSGFGQLLKGLK